MKNKEMTILKALGIVFVVMGHKYDPFKFFPIYGFHMALFFFASGYFYKEKYEHNILTYIIKKVKKTIPLYFTFNLFYMIVTYAIYIKYNFLLGSLPSIKSFFITPFINGHQWHLFLAGWFMLALLIVQIVFVIMHKYMKKITNNINIKLIIFLIIGLSSTFMAKYMEFTNSSPLLIVIRTCFGLFFYYLGYYYKLNESKNIFSTFNITLVIIVQVIIDINIKSSTYSLVWGEFYGNLFLPFITSINGIYVCLFISKALSKVVKENDLLYKIGENTASVMFHHLFVFFIINYVMLKITNGDLKQLSSVWFGYKVGYYWLIYVILGVLIPVYSSVIFKLLEDKLLKLYKKERKLNINR